MDDRTSHPTPAAAPEIAATYRWRRREVMPVRVTWLGMVLVLCLMTHRAIVTNVAGLGMTGKVGAFIAVVILPMLALVLWRAGLLPPERVRVEPPRE